jgi:hypothetical protein
VNINMIAAGILSPPPAAAAAAATTATPATRRLIGDIIGSFWNDKQNAKLFMNAKQVAANCCTETILHRRSSFNQAHGYISDIWRESLGRE